MDLDMRYASTSELIEDLEAILTMEQSEPLCLVPMEAPLLESAQLEELQRVWGRYTGSSSESEYTHSPMGESHPISTPSSGETWVHIHNSDEKASVEPEPSKQQTDSSNTVRSTDQEAVAHPKSSRTLIWILGIALVIFVRFILVVHTSLITFVTFTI